MACFLNLDRHSAPEALDFASIQIAGFYKVLVINWEQKRSAGSLSAH